MLLVETRPLTRNQRGRADRLGTARGLMLQGPDAERVTFSPLLHGDRTALGLRNGMECSTLLSFSLLIAPSNASCVSTTTTSPGSACQHRVGIAVDI